MYVCVCQFSLRKFVYSYVPLAFPPPYLVLQEDYIKDLLLPPCREATDGDDDDYDEDYDVVDDGGT